jgi:hypothetical protein
VADTANTPFSQEEICAQAQGNAAAWILTMITYLKERGLPVEDCVAYHGRRFAPAWEELRGRPVEEVAQLVALNALSVENTLRSLSSEDGRAELLVEGWPDEELMSLLPLDRDDCDQIYAYVSTDPAHHAYHAPYGPVQRSGLVGISTSPKWTIFVCQVSISGRDLPRTP